MKIQPGIGYTFDSSAKGFTLDTSEQFPDNTYTTHPFQVIPIGTVSGSYRYMVVSGTINNLVPEIDDVITSSEALLDRTSGGLPYPPNGVLTINTSTKESWIYLRSGPASASPYAFPDSDITASSYPKVISSNVELTDTDTYGYMLLAKFTMDSATSPTFGTLNQNVSGSLWADRLKTGTDTARYYYAGI